MPLLGALQATPMPKDVEFRSAALHMAPASTGEAGAAILLELPLKNIKFNVDPAKKSYTGHFSVLALLKNEQGTVVKKWNRDVPTQGAADKLQAVQAGFFTLKDQFSVPPGRYTLEAAVMDREGSKLGARKSAFVVAAKPQGVSMSNIDLVRRYEPNAQGLDPSDPFQFQGGRITPTLISTISGGKGSQLTMFFVVYPDPAIATKPEITLEYMKDGQVVGKGSDSASGRRCPGTHSVRNVVVCGSHASGCVRDSRHGSAGRQHRRRARLRHCGVRTMRCRAAAVILLTNVLALDAAAQSKQAEPLQTTVEEVVLDLIVRDKSGHPARDLRPEEVTVLDNGSPRPVSPCASSTVAK